MKDTKFPDAFAAGKSYREDMKSPARDLARITATSIRRMLAVVALAMSFSAPFHAAAQTIDNDARSPHALGNNSKQQQKAEKKKEKQKAELQKAIKVGKKRHMSYQEKAVRRRMKKSMKKAKKWNSR